jgi:3-isopropylmalate dehydrogenase
MPKIAVLAGDGIGPEMVAEGIKVLKAAAARHSLSLDFQEGLVGGAAYDATGHPLPPETLDLVQGSDAVYFGSVGGPKYDAIPDPDLRPERGALLPLRRKLELYANLRPCVLYPALSRACPLRPDLVEGGFDILVVRELTGGLYFGQPKEWSGDRAVDTCVYTRDEITRIAHIGFQSAWVRGKRLLSVDKANVMETSRLWRDTVTNVAASYPDVALSHQLVDAAAMDLVRRPQSFDVIVTENLFGDILSDEAAQLTGSLGMLPSASLGTRKTEFGTFGLFEPSGGSAPDIAGTGRANPLAAILSGALLLRYALGAEAAAKSIENAVVAVLQAGIRTADIRGEHDAPAVSCAEMGDRVVSALA